MRPCLYSGKGRPVMIPSSHQAHVRLNFIEQLAVVGVARRDLEEIPNAMQGLRRGIAGGHNLKQVIELSQIRNVHPLGNVAATDHRYAQLLHDQASSRFRYLSSSGLSLT